MLRGGGVVVKTRAFGAALTTPALLSQPSARPAEERRE
jgi:hypothetical protein